MGKTNASGIPDYQQQFSSRSIRNYVASAMSPFVTNGLSSMLFSTYLTFVYTEYLGVAAAAIAGVVSVGVIIDTVTDFLMGMVTDRVITKWGKARHWFFISALPMTICMALMFMVPEAGTQTMKLAWAFIFYNLFCIFNTTVRMPANAFPVLVSDNPKVRANMAWAFNMTASIAVSSLAWIVSPLLGAFGQNLQAYRIASAVCAAVVLVLMLVLGLLLQEQRGKEEWKELNDQYRAEHNLEKNVSIGTQLKYLFSNKYWVHFFIISLFNGAGITFMFGVIAYWVQFVAGNPMVIAGLMTALNIPTMIGCFLYAPISQKVSAKTVAVWFNLLAAFATLAAWIVGANNISLFIILIGVKSFLSGVASPVSMVVASDIVDYGEWKNGLRQDGLCNSGVMLSSKIMSAIGTALTGIILSAAGYVGGTAPSAGAVSAINFLFIGLPTIALFITVILWFTFKLDAKTADQCRAEIKARHNA